jgi:cytochrome oxidase Cu insertion factor (SCO1/SenC/PrrC family)
MSTQCNLKSVGIALIAISSLVATFGCHGGSTTDGAASVLTDSKIVDQNGDAVELSSLKGKSLVVDFIYTSCRGHA